MTDDAKSIFELDHETIMRMLRAYGQKIGLLSRRGDPLSMKLKAMYQYVFDHPTDERGDREMRALLNDWMKMHLEVTSRLELARKYGYLVAGEDPSGGQKIVTLQ